MIKKTLARNRSAIVNRIFHLRSLSVTYGGRSHATFHKHMMTKKSAARYVLLRTAFKPVLTFLSIGVFFI